MSKESVKKLLLPILLLASLALNLGQAVRIGTLSRVDKTGVVGTYATSNGGPGARYFVLERDGVCAAYEQFGDVEEGTYRLDDIDTPESPLTMAFPSQTLCALRVSGRLYLYDPEADYFFLLQKLSDTPTYINVEH